MIRNNSSTQRGKIGPKDRKGQELCATPVSHRRGPGPTKTDAQKQPFAGRLAPMPPRFDTLWRYARLRHAWQRERGWRNFDILLMAEFATCSRDARCRQESGGITPRRMFATRQQLSNDICVDSQTVAQRTQMYRPRIVTRLNVELCGRRKRLFRSSVCFTNISPAGGI